jgi:CBS domain-containing protein
MRAKDLMRHEVVTVQEDDTVEDLVMVFVGEHIHGAPVVDGEGKLVGIVTQQDLFFGSMTKGTKAFDTADGTLRNRLLVRDIMTAPVVSVNEDTEVDAVCQLMHKLRIHRLPVVRDGEVTGIVSSLDVCGAIARGEELD